MCGGAYWLTVDAKKKKKFIQLNVLLLGSAEGRNHSPYNALSVCPLVSLCMFASASLF